MGEMRSAVWFAEEREGTKKNFFMSFSFEFQIFFAAPFDFAFAVSERASEGLFGEGATLSAEQRELEFDLLSIRQKRRLRAETAELESRMTTNTTENVPWVMTGEAEPGVFAAL